VRPHEGPIPRSTAERPLHEVHAVRCLVHRLGRRLGVTGTRRLYVDWVGGGPPLRPEPLGSLNYSAQGSPPDRVGRCARVTAWPPQSPLRPRTPSQPRPEPSRLNVRRSLVTRRVAVHRPQVAIRSPPDGRRQWSASGRCHPRTQPVWQSLTGPKVRLCAVEADLSRTGGTSRRLRKITRRAKRAIPEWPGSDRATRGPTDQAKTFSS
jgi:hypothetical protein